MKKVFVVTSGDYSDYHIVGIYSTHELAMEYKEHLGADRIEEFELDPFINSLYSKGYIRFVVHITDRRTSVEKFKNDYNLEYLDEKRVFANRNSDTITVYLFAKDEKHAVKIASEIRAQIKASGMVEQYFQDHPGKPYFEGSFGKYTSEELEEE